MWYYIVLLLLLYLYTAYGKPSQQESYIVGGIAAALVMLAIYHSLYKTEHFIDSSSSDLDSLLRMFGINKSADSYIAAETNEDLADIDQGLVLYYSTFSKSSYQADSNTWTNIATYFKNDQPSCPEVKYSQTHATFSSIPSYSRDLGFALNQNRLTGPKSHMMGIAGSASFSIALVMRFNSFSASTFNFEIYQQFANTTGNNGVRLYIKPNMISVGSNGYAVNVVLQIGNETEFVARVRNENGVDSDSVIIDTSSVYLFIISKDNNSVSLTAYPNVNNLSSSVSQRQVWISDGKITDTDLLFSNKPMMINKNANLTANMYSAAIYNRALDTDQGNALFLHYKTELSKTNVVVQEFVKKINDLKSSIENSKMCPYADTVCEKCSNIRDWRDMQSVAVNASRDCLDAIHKFCTQNPTNPRCICWNPNSSASKTVQCQNFVSIFSNAPSCDIGKIDATMIEQLKKQNHLCSCQDIDAIRQAVLDGQKEDPDKEVTVVDKTTPRPIPPVALDPNNYYVDNDYIQVYEKYSMDLSVPPSRFMDQLVNWFKP